jgi:hypothetical protein
MGLSLSVAAENYLADGCSIIALRGKRPNTIFHPEGLLNPVTGRVETQEDVDQLHFIFDNLTTTGIGIVIEFPYFVVDVDGEEGAAQLAGILGTTDLPWTPIAKTGRGLHIWMADLAERRSRKLGTKLDLKGVGGYVAAPPSRHFDKKGTQDATYEWLVGFDEARVMEIPAKLEKALNGWAAVERDTEVDWRPMKMVIEDGMLRAVTGPANIDGLIRRVREAVEGERNNVLAWAAMTASEEGVPLQGALERLGQAGIDAGLGMDEVRTTVRSAYKRKHRE